MDFVIKLANRNYKMMLGSYPYVGDENGYPLQGGGPVYSDSEQPKGWEEFKGKYDSNRRKKNVALGLGTLGGAAGMIGKYFSDNPVIEGLSAVGGIGSLAIGGAAGNHFENKMKPYGIGFDLAQEDKNNFYDILDLNNPKYEISEGRKAKILDRTINQPIDDGQAEYYGERWGKEDFPKTAASAVGVSRIKYKV